MLSNFFSELVEIAADGLHVGAHVSQLLTDYEPHVVLLHFLCASMVPSLSHAAFNLAIATFHTRRGRVTIFSA